MSIPRVVLLQPGLGPPGGGECVAAWAVQALRERFELTVLTVDPIDLGAVNAHYGTSLDPRDFRHIRVQRGFDRSLGRLPFRMAMLRMALFQRSARPVIARLQPDAVVGCFNEMDIGRHALQYVHYPALLDPRPAVDLRWYHLGPLVSFYRGLAWRITGISAERAIANDAVANSGFVADLYGRAHGVKPDVIHPPVPGGFPEVPWSQRVQRFVMAGRFAPEKRIEVAIRVLDRVRAAGHALSLHVVGACDVRGYERLLAPLFEQHRDWVHREGLLPRDEMAALFAGSRFGIHAMEGEHFGISVAEMQRAGCVVFAPGWGGPAEILGGDSRLLFRDEDEAVARITRVLSEPALQERMHTEARERARRFSAERFMSDFADRVEILARASS